MCVLAGNSWGDRGGGGGIASGSGAGGGIQNPPPTGMPCCIPTAECMSYRCPGWLPVCEKAALRLEPRKLPPPMIAPSLNPLDLSFRLRTTNTQSSTPSRKATPPPTAIATLTLTERPPFLGFKAYFKVYTWVVTTTPTGARLLKPVTLGAANGDVKVETHGT